MIGARWHQINQRFLEAVFSRINTYVHSLTILYL